MHKKSPTGYEISDRNVSHKIIKPFKKLCFYLRYKLMIYFEEVKICLFYLMVI